MNIDDFKSDWKKMNQSDDLQHLSSESIQDLIKKRNSQDLFKSYLPEALFISINLYLVCFFIAFNNQLELDLYRGLSIFMIISLCVQSGLIYNTIRNFSKQLNLTDAYQHTIDHLKRECQQLNNRYYTILGLYMPILFLCIVLIPKIYSENLSLQSILITYAICIVIFAYLSLRIYRYYHRLITNNNDFKMSLQEERQ